MTMLGLGTGLTVALLGIALPFGAHAIARYTLGPDHVLFEIDDEASVCGYGPIIVAFVLWYTGVWWYVAGRPPVETFEGLGHFLLVFAMAYITLNTAQAVWRRCR